MGIYDSGEDSIMDEDDAEQLNSVNKEVYTSMVNHLDVDYTVVESKLPKYEKQFSSAQISYLKQEINRRKSDKAIKQANK